MAEVLIADLETGLKALFRKAYLANLEIDGIEVSESDLETLEDLDSIEVLENFKDLIETLLSCKRDYRLSENGEVAARCEQFETMLQKLEAEVRNHFRVEQQLKLHADALQSKLDELSRSESHSPSSNLSRLSEHTRRQSTTALSQSRDIDNAHRRVASVEKDAADLRKDLKASRLLGSAEQKHRLMLRVEKECENLRCALEKRSAELERTRQEYDQMMRELQLYRAKKAQESVGKISRTSSQALTERQPRKSVEGEKKPESRPSEHITRPKTSTLTPPLADSGKRVLHHSRTISERIKGPVLSSRRPRV